MGSNKVKSTFRDGDRFRAKANSPEALLYRDREIVIVRAVNVARSRFLMEVDGEHFQAHRDWLYSYWDNTGLLEQQVKQ